jgi:hypothetical protein
LTGIRARQHYATMKANVSRPAVAAAFIVAICADAVEWGLLPFFAEGFASPGDDILDVVTCIILTMLLGWHLAFLPSFAVKLIPVADFAPTWTLAVFIASRSRHATVDVSADAGPQPPSIILNDKQPPALPENRN